MRRPTVRYARTEDGVTIAYSTFGEGALTVVLVPGLISQVEVAWEEPAFEHFMGRLATLGRVVMLDRRGTGLSDHSTASGERLGLPQLARDVGAVLDATGTERAVVFGFSLGGMTTMQFSVDFPERTQVAVVFGSSPRLTRAPGFDLGQDPAEIDEWVDLTSRAWGTGASVDNHAPTMADDDRFREWAGRLERHTSSPGMMAAQVRVAAGYDARPLLPKVTVPTLVLHRSDDRAVGVECGRYLAERIPGARFVELPGQDHAFFIGEQQPILDAVVAFLDEHVTGGELGAAVRRAERSDAYGQGWDSLTPSEREVAALAAAGLTNKEVAQRLRMSRYTVDGRLRRVFAKLTVSTRAALATEMARVDR